jgi:hypothetical protein
MFYEDLAVLIEALNLNEETAEESKDNHLIITEQKYHLPFNKYFVKRGYCLLTSRVHASEQLNKINIYLKNASTDGSMFRKFEDYIAKLIFEIPLPLNKTKLKLYLPPT